MFHASIVHFPVALLGVAALGYVLAWVRPGHRLGAAAEWLHGLGVLGLVAGVLSGGAAEEAAVHTAEIHGYIERHELLGFLSVWGFVLLGVWRYLRGGFWRERVWERGVFVGVFVGMFGVVLWSGHIGGKLVYEMGAGVEPMRARREEMRGR